jgi:DNA ligase-1
MREFAQLLENIENTTKTNAKVKYLVDYFDHADDQDKLWAIALFTHKRPKRRVNTRLLATWAMELSGLQPWLFEESYLVVGDLAETISLIVPVASESSSHSLTFWIEYLIELGDLEEEEKKQRILEAWNQLDKQELWVFNKLITGGFRIGVSKNLITRALARHLDMDVNVVSLQLMGDWKPQNTSFRALFIDVDTGAVNLSRPYPFYLAYPLEGEVSSLGDVDDWAAEWKWDGIRSQLIKRGGELYLWSRGEELITDKFPELQYLKDRLPDGVALDGELLPFKDGKPLSFALLQTRIGRKNVSKKHLKEAPAAILAYDLLEYNGQDLRSLPFQERREKLNDLVSLADAYPHLQLSQMVSFADWKELTSLREKSRENLAEGFMIKRKESIYQVGRKRGDWWKWKVDPFSVDAVMIYAQKGHGRRANIYSDYTFGVWHEGQLVPFAKAYSGLTDQELNQVTKFVQANTLERFGPVRTVQPTQVFEIHFEGIQASSRHKSGVAVRFPRIHRWRRDKSPEEANSLDDLKALIIV